MKTRIEKDTLGEFPVPADAYYGAQTARAVENFPVSGLRAHPSLLRDQGSEDCLRSYREASKLARLSRTGGAFRHR